MKKVLLSASLALFALSLTAQDRLVLYEEFTGENCPPCATYNPGLMSLINQHDNVMIIKYQVPIPSAGPIYHQNTLEPSIRRSYYSVSSAPNGTIDGEKIQPPPGQSSVGHIAHTTSAMLTAAANIPTPVAIEFHDYTWEPGSNSATFNIKVISTEANTYINAVLHVALLETLIYDTPPGTNGEKEFYNVVRKMYPSPQGQALQTVFDANGSQWFSFTAELPSYVDVDDPDLKFVAFVQDNTNKKVLNATTSENNIVSTVELAKDIQITAYPNPATQELNVKVASELKGEASIIVYDVMGREVLQSEVLLNGTSQVERIQIDHLAKGVYTLKLMTEQGLRQLKFTKQ